MLGIRDIASSRASKNWSFSSGAAQNVGTYTLTMVAGPVDVDNRRFRILSVPAVGGSMEVTRVFFTAKPTPCSQGSFQRRWSVLSSGTT